MHSEQVEGGVRGKLGLKHYRVIDGGEKEGVSMVKADVTFENVVNWDNQREIVRSEQGGWRGMGGGESSSSRVVTKMIGGGGSRHTARAWLVTTIRSPEHPCKVGTTLNGGVEVRSLERQELKLL